MYSTLEQFTIIKSCHSATELQQCQEDLEETQSINPVLKKLLQKRLNAFLTLDMIN